MAQAAVAHSVLENVWLLKKLPYHFFLILGKQTNKQKNNNKQTKQNKNKKQTNKQTKKERKETEKRLRIVTVPLGLSPGNS